MNPPIKYWIAVGLGSGLSSKAPGTTGTLGILPLILLFWEQSLIVWIIGLVILFLLSMWSIEEAGRILGEPDHGQIVIDEWTGMWLAAMGVIFLTDLSMFIGLPLAFVGFRIFDITKFWPACWAERDISGPLGVLMDDVVAGLYVVVLCGGFGIINRFTGG